MTLTPIDILIIVTFVVTCTMCIVMAVKLYEVTCRMAALELGYDIVEDRLSKVVHWLEQMDRRLFDVRKDTENLRDASVIIHRKGIRGTPKDEEVH